MLIPHGRPTQEEEFKGPKRVIVLGSTGSVGCSTLEVLSSCSHDFTVVGLAAGSNARLLSEQAHEFGVTSVALGNEGCVKQLEIDGSANVFSGRDSAINLINAVECDIVVSAITGFAGVGPTIAALNRGVRVALANKESLVCAGELVTKTLAENPSAELLPVDSEHSALFQCVQNRPLSSVDTLVLTASGGPFRNFSKEQLEDVTVEQALAHPTWNMGPGITIDSACLLNKALELIEAHWLFGMPEERIEVVVHPQSIVHSLVKFSDGSALAQMGTPDMKGPIGYALEYPHSTLGQLITPLDFSSPQTLEFLPLDNQLFPAVELARQCVREQGSSSLVLNAAKEVAVNSFIAGECSFPGILQAVQWALERGYQARGDSFEDLQALDSHVRREVKEQFF